MERARAGLPAHLRAKIAPAKNPAWMSAQVPLFLAAWGPLREEKLRKGVNDFSVRCQAYRQLIS